MMERTLIPKTVGRYCTWPINKTFEKPIGDIELKRSVYAGNDSRSHEPREDDEACHTFVALAECEDFLWNQKTIQAG